MYKLQDANAIVAITISMRPDENHTHHMESVCNHSQVITIGMKQPLESEILK